MCKQVEGFTETSLSLFIRHKETANVSLCPYLKTSVMMCKDGMMNTVKMEAETAVKEG